MACRYREEIEKEMKTLVENITDSDIETLWKKFKNIVIETAKTVCGTFRKSNEKPQTAWWNENIKQEVKIKKEKWLKYLNNKNEENYNQYKEQRTKVKSLVREGKQEKWNDLGEKLEKDSKGNQKLFYKVLKTFRNKPTTDIVTIKNEDGQILIDEKQIMRRWKEYFENLLNPFTAINTSTQGTVNNSIIKEKVKISLEELTAAVKKLKNGKAAGYDKITGEMLKNMGEWGARMLLKLYNTAIKEEKVPHDWTVGMILPIYKKGNKYNCDNYRGITLLSVVLKVYEQIIQNKLRKIIEPTLTQSQCGFRKGRSAQEHIFTLKNIIDKAMTTKKTKYLAFLDLEKAFDRVPRAEIWKSLQSRNVNEQLIRIIKSMYKDTTNCVATKNMVSEMFTTKEGVRQGGGLSPLLFITYMDDIIKETKKRTRSAAIGHRNLKTVKITELAFADDVVLLADSEESLQFNLNVWKEVLERKGMKLNKGKTKVMAVTKEEIHLNIQIEGENIEQVTTFKYLGVNIEQTGSIELEIAERITKTNKLYYAINKGFTNRTEISRHTKMKVFKVIYRPILTYGSESWILTQRQKSKITAVEMRYLRRVKGVTRKDRIRNEHIREELEIIPILDFIEQKQLGWWGHLIRLKERTPVIQVWESRTQGRRKRGRPKKTWDSTIESILQRKGKTIKEAKTMARNKKEWRSFVNAK